MLDGTNAGQIGRVYDIVLRIENGGRLFYLEECCRLPYNSGYPSPTTDSRGVAGRERHIGVTAAWRPKVWNSL